VWLFKRLHQVTGFENELLPDISIDLSVVTNPGPNCCRFTPGFSDWLAIPLFSVHIEPKSNPSIAASQISLESESYQNRIRSNTANYNSLDLARASHPLQMKMRGAPC